MQQEVRGVRSPNLYELCEQLEESGANENFTGRLYIAAVIGARKLSISRSLNNSKNLKEQFQKGIRSRFGATIVQINQGYSINSIIKRFSRRINLMPLGENPEGVENVLYQLAASGKYGRVGSAVIIGAQNYVERIPKGMRSFEYKLELEYDLVKRALEDRLIEG